MLDSLRVEKAYRHRGHDMTDEDSREDGPLTAEWLADGRFEVEIALRRVAASASLRAPDDPANERIRA